jgi:hypothetical protein
MTDWQSRKVRFVGATVDDDNQVVRASVELRRPSEGRYIGRAERPSRETNLLWAGAQAAAEAVARAAGEEPAAVSVQNVARMDVFGADAIVVAVTARVRGETRSLFGVCRVDDEPAEAAALAVLSATNRVLDLS